MVIKVQCKFLGSQSQKIMSQETRDNLKQVDDEFDRLIELLNQRRKDILSELNANKDSRVTVKFDSDKVIQVINTFGSIQVNQDNHVSTCQYSVPHSTQKLIYGYIREYQHKFKLSSNIPSSIVDICVFMFYRIYQYEYFEKCGKDLKISGNKSDTISKQRYAWNYDNIAYGAKWINSNDSNVIRWTIKCIKQGQFKNGVIIGIVAYEIDIDQDPRWNENGVPSYFLMDGVFYANTKPINERQIKYGVQDSVLTMQLDLKSATLSYNIDGESYDFEINNIKKGDDIKYKLAISMWYENQSFQLTKFEFE